MNFLLILFLINYANFKQYRSIQPNEPASPREVVVVYRPTPLPEKIAKASWYDRSACGSRVYGDTCKTANGDIFKESDLTVACSSKFRLGSNIRLYYMDKSVDVVCTDRGNFERLGRDFDLTPAVFSHFADLKKGVLKVKYEVVVDNQVN